MTYDARVNLLVLLTPFQIPLQAINNAIAFSLQPSVSIKDSLRVSIKLEVTRK